MIECSTANGRRLELQARTQRCVIGLHKRGDMVVKAVVVIEITVADKQNTLGFGVGNGFDVKRLRKCRRRSNQPTTNSKSQAAALDNTPKLLQSLD